MFAKKIRQRTVLALAVLALSGGAASASEIFDFQFAGANESGSGVLNVQANGDGSFTAISGSGTDTVDGNTGSLALIFNQAGQAQSTSPSGFFFFDNQLSPSATPLLTSLGLLFSASTGGEVNLSFDPDAGGYVFDSESQQQFHENGPISFSVNRVASDVPEPATLSLFGLGLLGFVAARRLKTWQPFTETARQFREDCSCVHDIANSRR